MDMNKLQEIANEVLGRLDRGDIDEKTAREELTSAGIDPALATEMAFIAAGGSDVEEEK